MPVIPATQAVEKEKLWFQTTSGKKLPRSYLKNKPGAGTVAQVVEQLPSKHEALNSNPSTTKKKRRKALSSIPSTISPYPPKNSKIKAKGIYQIN
jgi:hypothetical protein